MASDEDEALLVVLAQSGDIASFEKLLRRLYAPLRKYVASMVDAATADDVLQEISLTIYRQIQYLREPKVFRAWVYRIATRIALVHLKREKRWRGFERNPELIDAIPDKTIPAEGAWDEEFFTLVDRVSPASRAVLLLHYQQHLSLEETAAILEIPLGTVKSRLSYGVAVLRNQFKEKKVYESFQSE